MRGNFDILAFNRGLISRLALARIDLKRTALSAETQTNWMPRSLGSMMLRPGLKYTGASKSNAAARTFPFIFSSTDTARIELTDLVMRVWVDDALVTRPAVTAAITNGGFDTDLTGWTDADEVGGASVWATGGYMSLSGNGTAAAIRRQEVTVNEANVQHALRIIVQRGPVTLRVGSTAGASDYINDASLLPGIHSITLTPTANFHIQLSNRTSNVALATSISIESSGTMEIGAPWAAADLSLVRMSQSGDVLFVACDGYQQRRIERRSGNSWSVVLYQPADGPFRVQNTSATTITASALSGNITLTASASLFRSGHVGALFQVTSVGQRVSQALTAENQFSSEIRVTGVGASRLFTIEVTGTFTATLTLQRSVGEVGSWEDVTTYTVPTSTTYNDALDNQIIYYRIGIKTGNYTSGTATGVLTYTIGSITGVARITAFTSETVVDAEVLTAMGGTTATDTWSEGAWSTLRGWPSAVALYEGRLFWAGKDKFWGSISDAFASFDAEYEGDAAPIQRSIGAGPVDSINWLMPMQRLLAGTDGSEISCKSTSFDEPLTPTNFNAKEASTQGTAKIQAVKIDGSCIFVQASGFRVYEMGFSVDVADYVPADLTAVVPEVGKPGILGMAVQRQPDTRLHCWRSDGKVAVLVFDPGENVNCWILVETDGFVEDVCVLPSGGAEEDQVYYLVRRTVNGATVRLFEKWALESECVGGTLNMQADSFATFTNSPAAASIPAGTASHLVGESVVVWVDGKCLTDANGDIALFTVAADGGVAALTNGGTSYTATTGIVGLAYTAKYKSTKLAYFSAQNSVALTQKKKVDRIGLVLADTHAKGIQYGPSFDILDDLPLMEAEAAVDQDSIWDSYDAEGFEFNGEWNTDSRVCLQANAPRPATVLGMVIGQNTNDKV